MSDNSSSSKLGEIPITPLLIKQAVPASVGILIMSIYGIVDTIFIGHWVGPMGIAGVTVVFPLTFLISSIGMAIGIGGGSIISRALGEGMKARASRTFGNQIALTLGFAMVAVLIGRLFEVPLLRLFGAQGEILEPSQTYFRMLLPGIPFLAFAMMSNNVIRAEGRPKVAMFILIIPAILNTLLDPIFIVWLGMGMKGAALATTISYIASAVFGASYFIRRKSELILHRTDLIPDWPILKETISIGSVTFARQGVIALLSIILNHSLFKYGEEVAVSAYGIIARLMMFANFPVIGLVQGFLPIAGYNYGAKHWGRVRKSVIASIKFGTGISICIFISIYLLTSPIVQLFSTDTILIETTIPAIKIAFLMTPLLIIQLIGSAYYQAIGQALPALFLALTKQGFFLIPLIIFFPLIFGLDGIWWSFPVADLSTAVISFFAISRSLRRLHAKVPLIEEPMVAEEVAQRP